MEIPDTSVLARIQLITGTDPQLLLQLMGESADKVHRLERERARLVAELTAYRARFLGGQSAHVDHERKVLLAGLKEQKRSDVTCAGSKITDGAVDDWAHAHPDYRAWLDTQQEDRLEMLKLEAMLAQVDADLEGERMRYRGHEYSVRIALALIGFARTEAGLTS